MRISQITLDDALDSLCAQIKPDLWAKDNEMTEYDMTTLRRFLQNQMNHLFVAWDGDKVAGLALCHDLLHPDGQEYSLYVHELDTHPDYRRRGVATQIMQYLFSFARKHKMSEVWLGTEADNETANAFYKTLSPDDEVPTIIYSYKVKSRKEELGAQNI